VTVLIIGAADSVRAARERLWERERIRSSRMQASIEAKVVIQPSAKNVLLWLICQVAMPQLL
jgi:hypothetical protein